VIVPQVESVADVQEAARATRYPPAGVRGVAGRRLSGYGQTIRSDVRGDDPAVVTVLQVETSGAVEDVEAVDPGDGLDALFVGSSDRSARTGT